MKKPPVHNNQYFAMSNVIIIQMLDFIEKKNNTQIRKHCP